MNGLNKDIIELMNYKENHKFYVAFDFKGKRKNSVIEITLSAPFWVVSKLVYGLFPENLGKYTSVAFEDETPDDIVEKIRRIYKKVEVLGPYKSQERAIQDVREYE